MHNELTRQDLELMRQELDHRRLELRPQLMEAVKEARGFRGPVARILSTRPPSRRRTATRAASAYLENMITHGCGHRGPLSARTRWASTTG